MGIVVVAVVGIVGAGLYAAAVWRRRSEEADLGTVSSTWISELRAGEPYDSSR